jgi:hypothetical protein
MNAAPLLMILCIIVLMFELFLVDRRRTPRRKERGWIKPSVVQCSFVVEVPVQREWKRVEKRQGSRVTVASLVR